MYASQLALRPLLRRRFQSPQQLAAHPGEVGRRVRGGVDKRLHELDGAQM